MATYEQTDERLTLPDSFESFKVIRTHTPEDPERQPQGVWFSLKFWFNRELSANEKMLLVEIKCLDNEQGCYASRKHFTTILNVTEARISQLLKSLETKNIIEFTTVTYQNGNWRRHISLTDKGLNLLSGGGKHTYGGSKSTYSGGKRHARQEVHNRSTDKKEEKESVKSKQQTSRPFSKTSLEMKMTNFAIKQIQKTHPHLKFTSDDKQRHCATFENLMRIDKHSKDDIRAVLTWLPTAVRNGDFCWADVVQSPCRLRDKKGGPGDVTKFNKLNGVSKRQTPSKY
jgi:DNA-binding PadR family transcriptional regulator